MTWLRSLVAFAGLVCALLLAGCSGGGVQDSVAQAVQEGSSSMGTARLAVGMDTAGKLTAAATSTVLDDALKELGKTRTTVLELSPTVRQDRELRDAAVAAMDESVSAVARAAEAVASEDGRPSMAEAGTLLDSAAAHLSSLEDRLGSP